MSKKPFLKNPLILVLLITSFTTDQLTKLSIINMLHLGESIPKEGFFRITYISNSGTIWGLFPEQTLPLIIGSFFGITLLIYLYHKISITNRLFSISIGLQLGGAFGNLIDRIRLGYVVDFIDVGSWPIFNIADCSIVVGIAILIFILSYKTENDGDITESDTEEIQPSRIVEEK
ncbi:MAG: signal peptidase II [Chloroflexi bacterium]|nr:signal peptidase II [Chloroflexota bacterium]|tara:strand:- start:8323 stop:8847 length:525 start_codon:yes stop_codon:yes gene_type:complete